MDLRLALFFLLSQSTLIVVVTGSPCSSLIYALFLPLSNVPAAESFCSTKFPVTPITVTSTASSMTSTVIVSTATVTSTTSIQTILVPVATTTVTVFGKKAKRHTMTPTSTRHRTSPTEAIGNSLLSALQSQASNYISTLCYCIEAPKTATTTSTPPTTTVTETSTTTTDVIATETACALPGATCVYDGCTAVSTVDGCVCINTSITDGCDVQVCTMDSDCLANNGADSVCLAASSCGGQSMCSIPGVVTNCAVVAHAKRLFMPRGVPRSKVES